MRTRRKPTLRDTMRANKLALDFLADSAGKPRLDIAIAPKREYKRNTDKGELEAGVLNAVGDLLAHHPAVLWAARFNSGSMQYQNARGDYVPVWFSRFVRRPGAMRIPDYMGMMKDGRFLALECKRRHWSGPHDIREIEQQAFLKCIQSVGGIGAFVRSSEEAQRELSTQHNTEVI